MPFEHIESLTEQEKEQLRRNKKYWADRSAATQAKLSKKTAAEIEKQLAKYYKSSMARVIGDFEKTYLKIISRVADGKEPTPADLYKLDTYWKMQGQLKHELQALGDSQLELFSKNFIQQYQQVYKALALPGDLFNEVDRETAMQMIQQIWCADGKRWSDRVWSNIDYLQQTLNDELLHCVLTGKKPTELKQLLQERFNVSYKGADMIARTEIAHIQTQAAKKRYQDYGLEEVEILADKDERQCEICGKLHGQRFAVGAQVPIPAHPRCRCCIVPVI